MEKYVVSRQLAEELIDAGYPQVGNQFMWVHRDSNKANIWYVLSTRNADRYLEGYSTSAAPLSDELLEQLKTVQPNMWFSGFGSWEVETQIPDIEPSEQGEQTNQKPADALAELWLWCKENGHLTKEG